MADNQDSKSQAADILVVDDTIASLRLLTEILSKEGYQVRPADEPHLALQSAMAHPPGLILLDVRMPDMDGFEVCRRLKQDERTRDVPVIFVSALQDVDDRVQGFEVGGVDFVSKPIEEAEVLARVKTHLLLRTMQLHLEELVAERTAELVQTNETLRREIAGRKQAEKALRESEARFRAIFDHAPMGIAVAGSDSFMVDANDAFQRMVGYTSQELGEIEVSALSPAEDNERELPLIQEVLQGSRDTYTFEKRFKHRDGREVWTQTHSAVVRDENGEVWFAIGLVQDITERKEAETQREAARRSLRESEERYRTLVEQAQDGIVVLQDGKVRFANSYVAGLSGRTVEELLDTPFEAYLPADQLPQIAEIYRRRISGEDVPSIHEAAIQHQNGSRVEVEFNAGLTTYDGRPATLVFVRDIRERVKARQELEASQRLLSLVSDNVPAQISYVDKRQRYRFVNRRYEDAYGLPPSEFVGKPVQEILGPEGYAAAEKQIAAALAGQRVSYEHVFHYPDRGQLWMSIDYVPDRNPGGDVQGFVGLVRDITESKQAEAALRESEEKLRAIYEAIPVAAYTWQSEGNDFVLVDYNEMAAKVTEGRIVDLVGERASEMYRDQPEIPEAMARCSSERLTIEKEMGYQLISTGRRRHLNVKYAFAPPDLVVVHTEDITARKQAEEALKTSETHLQRAQEIANAGSWELDLTSGGLFWSDEIYRIFGLPREAPLDYDTFLDCVLPEDRDYVYGSWQAAVAGAPYDIEHRIRVGDEVRWVREKAEVERNAAGQAVQGIGIVQDITQQKRAQEELRQSKERLEEAQRISQIGDWEHDLQAGEITWSREMYRIFGVDPQSYVPGAKADEEFYHPDDLPVLRRAFENFFAVGVDLDIEYRIVTRQGRVKSCRSRGRLILDDQGIHSHARGTTEDITERWLVEQQITEYQQRLQALASQLTLTEERERRRIARELHDEVGQTLAFARTRLASARKAPSEAAREAILEDISQALRQAIRDIRDLVFDLSSPLMNELGLGAALGEWLEDQVGKKHGLQTAFFYDGKRFPMDDDMRAILFRCTRELLTNVVKHARAKRVTVRLEDDGPLVRIVVEDDGIGYDLDATPDTMEREASFGLFSIQERMADLGGSLEIRSEPGQGCTAILTAPTSVQV